MKTITIITEELSERALAAALPTTGVAATVISRDHAPRSVHAGVENYRALRNPRHFRPSHRIDLTVEDTAVESVFDSVAVAYGAGVFSDAEMWVNPGALATAA